MGEGEPDSLTRDDGPAVSTRPSLRSLAATFGALFGVRAVAGAGVGTAAAVDHDGRAADAFTREERRDLVDDRLGFHRRRLGSRRRVVQVWLRSPDGQLLRYDRDEETAAITENGVVVAANEVDTDVNTDGSGCRVEGFDTDVDGGTDRIDLGPCGVVEITR